MAEFNRTHLTRIRGLLTTYFGDDQTPTVSYQEFVTNGVNFVTINDIPLVITHNGGNNYTFLIRGRLADYPFTNLATFETALAAFRAEPPE